jgi:hypothetical protein
MRRDGDELSLEVGWVKPTSVNAGNPVGFTPSRVGETHRCQCPESGGFHPPYNNVLSALLP